MDSIALFADVSGYLAVMITSQLLGEIVCLDPFCHTLVTEFVLAGHGVFSSTVSYSLLLLASVGLLI